MDAPTVTTGEALERAILDAPGEDTPQLALADFLDENGDPDRAEYIRAAVETDRGRKRGLSLHATACPTHRCRECDALWVEWPDDGGWSLLSPTFGPCCDNVEMGGQIVELSKRESDLYTRQAFLLAGHPEWSRQPSALVQETRAM